MRHDLGSRTSNRPREHVATPSQLGPWQIVEKIACARSRTTYAVTHAQTGEHATLDVYDAVAAGFGSSIRRLAVVMNALERIAHPAIATILDVGSVVDGWPFIVRESLGGSTLDARVSTAPLSTELALDVLTQISDAMSAAHASGVAHGRLDLDSVVLVDHLGDGGLPRIKLLDWGIANELSPAVDVHALGVMMHWLLGQVPRVLAQLWMTMLAHDPSARPPMSDVALCLRAIEPRDVADAARPPKPRTPKPRRPNRVVTSPPQSVPIVTPARSTRAATLVPPCTPAVAPPRLRMPVATPRPTRTITIPPASIPDVASSPASVTDATPRSARSVPPRPPSSPVPPPVRSTRVVTIPPSSPTPRGGSSKACG